MRCNGALCRQRTRGLCNVSCGQSSTRQWHTQGGAAAKQLCVPLPARAITHQREVQLRAAAAARTAAVGAACCPDLQAPRTRAPRVPARRGAAKSGAGPCTRWILRVSPTTGSPHAVPPVSTSVPGGAGRGLRAQHTHVSPLLPWAWLLQLPSGALVQDVICTCLQLWLERLCNCCILRKK